jgi:uncharacterized protein DUF998
MSDTRQELVPRRAEDTRGGLPVTLAWCVIAAMVIFNAGWLLAGALERHGYSPARHDVSDLTAITAHHAWVMFAAQGIAAAATIAFAIGALRPSLALAGRRDALGAWLLAGSLMAVDNVSDIFFRLDCRAADPRCTLAASATSTHGKVHIGVGIATAAVTLAVPFVLARRMRSVSGWRDFSRPTLVFGIVFAAAMVSYGSLDHSSVQGYAQRAAIVLASIGVAALAIRVRTLARVSSPA